MYLRPPSYRSNRGIALVLVLAALVLLTVLVLAFLAGVGSEVQTSKMYANGSSVKLLAQSCVSLAMGEIQTATSDQTLCWASEPGMIRTYKNDGTAAGYYKLYSDDAMSGTAAFDHTKVTNLVPDGTSGTTAWYKQKGVYVDLNQPITYKSANYYPILDGNSADYGTVYANPLATQTLPAATSSISSLKPVGPNGLPSVNGFWLNSNTPKDPSSPNVAPMPVKWLYVLQKGEVIIPDSNPTNGVVTFNNIAGQPKPSVSDPIVGRMAFWTDDDTCKVNVNTASEGTAWDTPRAYSQSDYAYAINQPVQNEFQRYPGHPATVCLSAVFNGLNSDASYPEDIYSSTTTPSQGLAPRTTQGGSKSGTVATSAIAGALTMQGNRLYSTADEFLFQPWLSGTVGTGTRQLNSALASSSVEIDSTALQKAGFFITANSEAPDVNVFNLPRVSMWPITVTGSASAPTPAMTAYDELIAFCSTINNSKYYFERLDPLSPTTDLPTGGSGGDPTKLLERNRDLLEYLRTLTSQKIPGFGGSFADKYKTASGTPDDRDQILTEMFDYIRCTNLGDSSTGATVYAPSASAATTSPYRQGGIGMVVPILDRNVTITDVVSSGTTSSPRGFGRFPSVQQACLIFIGAGDEKTPAPPALQAALNPNPPTSYTPKVLAGQERVQAGFFLQMYDPTEGIPITRPWYMIKVSNLDNLQWNGKSIFTTSTGTIQPTTVDAASWALDPSQGKGFSGFNYGGMVDFRSFCLLRGSVINGYGAPLYPFISPPTGQTGTAPDFTANGTFNFTNTGDVVVEIYALDTTGAPSTKVQTVNLKFPSGTFPVPTSINNDGSALSTNPAAGYVPTGTPASSYPTYDFLSFVDSTKVAKTVPVSFTVSGTNYGNGMGRLDFPAETLFISKNDVVRAVIASDPSVSTSNASPGDMRLVAARQTVSDAFFQPITGSDFPSTVDYSSSSVSFSYFLRILTGFPLYGSIGGKLISASGGYSGYSAQYLTQSAVANDTTFPSFSGSSASRPKDPIVANQGSSVLIGNDTTKNVPGDWDNGIENSTDGAYINRPDEGDAGRFSGGAYVTNGYPYFELDYGTNLPGPTFFSPNRMIPSPGMFGSLPSGVWNDKAWQTLLFRPGPAGHPGLGTISSGSSYSTPPDHLFMDLFNMPVVEPYAISTPLATAGRINMNYLIVPFTYINRDTGLRAAMKSQSISSIPSSQQRFYKLYQNTAGGPAGGASGSPPAAIASTRYSINLDATLSQFLMRFYSTNKNAQGSNGAPDIFHAASEICDIDLVPNDTTAATASFLNMPITRANMDKYWNANALTGDNSRERPYANLYPLLTTKSNTFTVHFRVQTLKQAPSSTTTMQSEWREGTDVVLSEYRGSQTIERYVDPTANLPDYATVVTQASPTPSTPLSSFYKLRIVSSKQFPP